MTNNALSRFIKSVIILAGCSIPFTSLALEPDAVSATTDTTRAANDFAARLANAVIQLIHDAGAIDRSTGLEMTDARRGRILRQRELHSWFLAKGKSITEADCQSEVDRKNYRDFRDVMANRQFLRLPLAKRQKYLRELSTYFDYFAGHFGATALNVVRDAESQKILNQTSSSFQKSLRNSCLNSVAVFEKLTACSLATAIARDINVEIYYFNRDRYKAIGAFYIPKSSTMLFNLDLVIESPAEFIDAFEHELWHHLLPPPDYDHLSANIWWEGTTEMISEMWSAQLHAAANLPASLRSDAIQYPIQTAFASLQGARVTPTLLTFFRKSQQRRCDPSLHARIESILSDWGWKEDDESAVRVSRFYDDGVLSDEALETAFRMEKQFLLDFIQALTVVQLQDLKAAGHGKTIGPGSPLPPHLQRNLRKVLSYVDNPSRQLANR